MSSNSIESKRLETFLKSLIYKRNKRGANIDPGGTPHSASSKLVFVLGPLAIYCFLFERKLFIQLWMLPLIPYNSSFLSCIVWSAVSKAFERSINPPSVQKLFSKASNTSSTSSIIAWSVEWLTWKPSCLE